ncbi:hypothetical protein DFP72DRAFT_868259 [Ephemerocybe angulata]|uniref:Secreted protein n=1 Tax=Ephemerocybe angulata TaxID=980116 RepID=A0A8H6MHL9_9AGAR|nr:hypothetical protein DFP72DRAFT_868259 [Tulosesus angulatus]
METNRTCTALLTFPHVALLAATSNTPSPRLAPSMMTGSSPQIEGHWPQMLPCSGGDDAGDGRYRCRICGPLRALALDDEGWRKRRSVRPRMA